MCFKSFKTRQFQKDYFKGHLVIYKIFNHNLVVFNFLFISNELRFLWNQHSALLLHYRI
jgi:hypothetical protein